MMIDEKVLFVRAADPRSEHNEAADPPEYRYEYE